MLLEVLHGKLDRLFIYSLSSRFITVYPVSLDLYQFVSVVSFPILFVPMNFCILETHCQCLVSEGSENKCVFFFTFPPEIPLILN